MLPRAYEPLDRFLQPNKVLLLYGPRRVGKTTLLMRFLEAVGFKFKLDSGDDIRTRQILGSQDFSRILAYAEGYELIALDEAQGIPNIGMGLKILVDQVPGIRVIATGSSSFELAGQVGEPLTGRKHTLTLYPMAQAELLSRFNRFELRERLGDFLIYGSYPEVLQAGSRSAKVALLNELVGSYLMKDVLAFERVKSSRTLLDLLRLLAFQVGGEVSFSELALNLKVDVKTVQRYVDLLEKAFVIVRLTGFRRNLREEIASKSKIYFLDTGVRNSVVNQFNLLDQRNDVGSLWENFVFVERLKRRTYYPVHANAYFWRTYAGQEIDLVEERDGGLFGYEAKWSTRKSTAPQRWLTAYPEARFEVITPDNYLDFILP
jgi:predicted AAA+ superfamily ATPase